MLKITLHEQPGTLVFQLEGKLAEAWVPELERYWRDTSSKFAGQTFRIDLEGVHYLDDAGKYLLILLRYWGVELSGRGLQISELLQSIYAEWPVNEKPGSSECKNLMTPSICL